MPGLPGEPGGPIDPGAPARPPDPLSPLDPNASTSRGNSSGGWLKSFGLYPPDDDELEE